MKNTVKYQGKLYKTDLQDDKSGAGGLLDLSKAFASTICCMTDPCNYSHYEDIQKEVYGLVKYGVIGELQKTSERGAELC